MRKDYEVFWLRGTTWAFFYTASNGRRYWKEYSSRRDAIRGAERMKARQEKWARKLLGVGQDGPLVVVDKNRVMSLKHRQTVCSCDACSKMEIEDQIKIMSDMVDAYNAIFGGGGKG